MKDIGRYVFGAVSHKNKMDDNIAHLMLKSHAWTLIQDLFSLIGSLVEMRILPLISIYNLSVWFPA